MKCRYKLVSVVMRSVQRVLCVRLFKTILNNDLNREAHDGKR